MRGRNRSVAMRGRSLTGGAFTPLNIASQVATFIASPDYCFLDAGTTPAGDTDTIQEWHSLDGSAVLEQADSGLRPTLNLVSGKWMVTFDGVDNFMAYTTSWSGSYSIGWAGKLLAAGDFPCLVALKVGAEHLQGSSTSGFPMIDSAATNATLAASIVGSFVRLIATSDTAGPMAIYRDNGTPATASNAGDRTVDTIRLGARVGDQFANAQVAGVSVFNAALTAGERTAMDTYLESLLP